ncbi:MAG: dTDP-4-dehydrorhamnose reductase [Erythrobacter sp.]|nr:dTDP-4-dehydrorhamnose reductase [Erythrobacter sp.]
MNKVLVTGAAGQLGRTILAASPMGWECRGLTRHDLDLRDAQAIESLIMTERPELVINAGAYTAVDRAEAESDLAMVVNARAPGALAGALSTYGGRLVQISTDYVFDGRSSRPYLPTDPVNPLSVYGTTKAAGESAAGPDAIILRTSWVHAAGGQNFVTTMLRLMREREELSVVCDQIGAPSWAPDIARTIWQLAAQRHPGIYHHCDAGQATWYELARAIADEALALGLISRAPKIRPVTSDLYPAAARRPAYSVLDDSDTRALLGDATAHWRVNLRRMLEEQATFG